MQPVLVWPDEKKNTLLFFALKHTKYNENSQQSGSTQSDVYNEQGDDQAFVHDGSPLLDIKDDSAPTEVRGQQGPIEPVPYYTHPFFCVNG